MKKVIVFALILLSLSSYSQTETDLMRGWGRNKPAFIPADTVRLDSVVYETGTPINDTIIWGVHDTIPCIMLVCDTSYNQPNHYDPGWPGALYDDKHMVSVWVMYGFAVRSKTELTGYLSSEKKPVKLFVWMSKNLK